MTTPDTPALVDEEVPMTAPDIPAVVVTVSDERPEHDLPIRPTNRCPFCNRGTLTASGATFVHESATLAAWACDVCPYHEGRL